MITFEIVLGFLLAFFVTGFCAWGFSGGDEGG